MATVQYEIRVAGAVPVDVLDELDDVQVITRPVETVLRGPVPDQAALIGIINRLHGWGIELHAVRQLPPEPDDAPADLLPANLAPQPVPSRPGEHPR